MPYSKIIFAPEAANTPLPAASHGRVKQNPSAKLLPGGGYRSNSVVLHNFSRHQYTYKAFQLFTLYNAPFIPSTKGPDLLSRGLGRQQFYALKKCPMPKIVAITAT